MQNTVGYLWSPWRTISFHVAEGSLFCVLGQSGAEAGALALFSTSVHRVGNIKAHLCEPEKGR